MTLDATPMSMNDATPMGWNTQNIAGLGRQWPNYVNTTTNFPWGHHPTIKKQEWASPRPWVVTGHLAGKRQFRTWEQARAYALAKVELTYEPGLCPNARLGQITACNCVGACQPRQTWVAHGYKP